MKLHLVQAEHGDCFLLEGREDGQPRFILVDGGPAGIFPTHLQAVLSSLVTTTGLAAVMLSHVDDDHIVGLLDLMADLRDPGSALAPLPIGQLLFNSFSRTIGHNNDVGNRLRSVIREAGLLNVRMPGAEFALLSVGQGDQLSRAAQLLDIPINPTVPNGLISVESVPAPFDVIGIQFRIVGPTAANLEALRKSWKAWLTKRENAIANARPDLLAMSDKSIPNLSSICVLAESDGRRMLLTGDARGDFLLQGLEQANLLDNFGKLHVGLLKVPHHGSDRNVTQKFFERITADQYVISANGKHGNPDFPTLTWIVKTAQAQNRPIELIVTNRTPTVDRLIATHPPAQFGYSLMVLPPQQSMITI